MPVLVLSEMTLERGMRKRAKILSRVMIRPIRVMDDT
jgi:hypothetical protein